MKLGIVVADFNEGITSLMLAAAQAEAKRRKAECVIAHVPGAFELPLAVQRMLSCKEVGAVVVLGAIIKGETSHDEVIAKSVANALMELMLRFDTPVTLSIIGPDVTWDQATKRAEPYAQHGVEAALAMVTQ